MKSTLINTCKRYATSADEVRAYFGEKLSSFKQAELQGVWSLWDAKASERWCDWAVVLETSKGHVSINALSGIKLAIWFDEVDFDGFATFYEEGCYLNDLFALSWTRHEELAFLEGRTLDDFSIRCDGGGHPFALDVVLNDLILSIGGPWDETIPLIVSPGESWDEGYVDRTMPLS